MSDDNSKFLASLATKYPLPLNVASILSERGVAAGLDYILSEDNCLARDSLIQWLAFVIVDEKLRIDDAGFWTELPAEFRLLAVKWLGPFWTQEWLFKLLEDPMLRWWTIEHMHRPLGTLTFAGGTYGTGVRNQVFEVVVRQAIAGAPWREICVGPMEVNDILEEEVVYEMTIRQLNKMLIRQTLPGPAPRTLQKEEAAQFYGVIAGGITDLMKRAQTVSADQRWKFPNLRQCMRMYAMSVGRMAFFDTRGTAEVLRSVRDRTFRATTNRAEAERILMQWYREWNYDPPREVVWCSSPKSAREMILASEFTWDDIVGPCFSALRASMPRMANSWIGPDPITPLLFTALTGQLWWSERHSVVSSCSRGQFDLSMLTMLDSMQNLVQFPACKIIADAANVCGFWWPTKDKLIVTDKPLHVGLDEAGRFHNDSGPALEYHDWSFFAWHGVMVPDYVVMKPEAISLLQIDTETNTELRRVLIERFGMERFIRESDARVLHSNERGVLYIKELRDDEPLVMVKVINSTAEPDGTFKEYFLRVPPTINTVTEAIAWTFDLQAEEYSPSRET